MLLKQEGATVVLNGSEANFDQQLRDACHQHDSHLAFDAVAGLMTGQLLAALLPHSKVTVYGGLSRAAVQAGPDQLILKDKAIDGFWLGPWLRQKDMNQIQILWQRAQKLLSKELKTEIRARYPLQEVKKAVQAYQRQMTGGKVLLSPG